jgi:NAD(P)H-hydrate epimerase
MSRDSLHAAVAVHKNLEDAMSSELPKLKQRSADSHKGDFGRALLVGSSRGMTGAIALAGMAALRSGAGLVTLAVPNSCLDTVAAMEASYMTLPLPDDEQGRISAAACDQILREADQRTALAFGPGLGRSDELDQLAAWLYACIKQPMVIDADALNSLAGQDDVLKKPGGPRILTPHPGELERLTNVGANHRQRQIDAATQLAERCGIVLLLKGHHTVITDGKQHFVNETGNPGMATGGAGDVLTGVITGLLCQGLTPLDAARLGAHVHGRAGDFAAEELGQISMTAQDMVQFLPDAFCEICEA